MGGAVSVDELSQPQYSNVVPNSERAGLHGPIHRSVLDFGPELSMPGNVQSAYENFNRGVALSGDRPCLGHRPISASGEALPFVWESYNQVRDRRDNFGSGLTHLGLWSRDEAGMTMLGIYSQNRPEWVIAEQACYAFSATVVPLYDTLGPEAVAYAVNQTALTTIVCSAKEIAAVVDALPLCPSLVCAIVMDRVSPEMRADLAKRAPKLKVMDMAEVEDIGQHNRKKHVPPSAGDVASFCYTSGTTGDPKGALISHGNLMADGAGARRTGVLMSQADIHLSYLPLPHMFERLVQLCLFNEGAAIGFYQGDTLKIVEDLTALRPTVFPSVPRLLTRVHDKLTMGVKEAGGLKEALFNKAFAAKLANMRATGSLSHSLWDPLVFRGVKAKVGLDRVRVIITGSAPIAPHVMDFLRVVFGCSVMEGYGQTESTAASTITFEDDTSTGHVGGPVPANEIALFDVPEMGYLQSDTRHGDLEVAGRGEICFRGPNVFKGYYKMAEKTAETVDSDGWLHSGDIGVWLPSGALKIVDRKKNIFKLSQGEYVAPEKIENIYNRSELVMQSFVHGDSLQPNLVAIVVPDPDAAAEWALRNKKKGDVAALCADPAFKAAVAAQMEKQAVASKLKGFERAKAIHLEPVAWTPESGVLTPTFKLKRQQARQKYEAEIAALYK